MKKNIVFVSISVILLILLGIGVSYSMWNMKVSQDTNNINNGYPILKWQQERNN